MRCFESNQPSKGFPSFPVFHSHHFRVPVQGLVEKRKQASPSTNLQLDDFGDGDVAEEDFAEGSWDQGKSQGAGQGGGSGMVLRGIGGGPRSGVGL
jgi:hypothetical protein